LATAETVLRPLSSAELASLSRVSGLPLGAYRPDHVQRCVGRALTRTGAPAPRELIDRLLRDEPARAAFRRSVLVPVTRMFRDQAEFELLERDVLPELLASRDRLAIWSAGCASGDELRSVAVLLERLGALQRARLLGSDVLEEALDAARASLEGLPPETRAALWFERRDLVTDSAPERRFDLVLCRNVAIYLEPAAQQALHRKVVAALRPGGFLLLGRSETLVHPDALALQQVSRHAFRKAST
jgi:chemotaxis protein methyltransferase CheR